MKKLTLLSITLLTAGNALAMDVAQQAQPLTPRTTRILKALNEYNDPAQTVVYKMIPQAPPATDQLKTICEKQISGNITEAEFKTLHDNLKAGQAIIGEGDRLLLFVQGGNTDERKKEILQKMRSATAAHYSFEQKKATLTRDGYVASAAAIINKLQQDKSSLTFSDEDRLNREHLETQAEMLKYNAQIMVLTENAKEADAEYAALLTPGITLANDDK
ncbi:MAG TPA: hypothetical protein VLH77_04390 [Gammaproteobacteria bacterium]|nr:hypothetical protein [Gammaproteobacteria bacterium]